MPSVDGLIDLLLNGKYHAFVRPLQNNLSGIRLTKYESENIPGGASDRGRKYYAWRRTLLLWSLAFAIASSLCYVVAVLDFLNASPFTSTVPQVLVEPSTSFVLTESSRTTLYGLQLFLACIRILAAVFQTIAFPWASTMNRASFRVLLSSWILAYVLPLVAYIYPWSQVIVFAPTTPASIESVLFAYEKWFVASLTSLDVIPRTLFLFPGFATGACLVQTLFPENAILAWVRLAFDCVSAIVFLACLAVSMQLVGNALLFAFSIVFVFFSIASIFCDLRSAHSYPSLESSLLVSRRRFPIILSLITYALGFTYFGTYGLLPRDQAEIRPFFQGWFAAATLCAAINGYLISKIICVDTLVRMLRGVKMEEMDKPDLCQTYDRELRIIVIGEQASKRPVQFPLPLDTPMGNTSKASVGTNTTFTKRRMSTRHPHHHHHRHPSPTLDVAPSTADSSSIDLVKPSSALFRKIALERKPASAPSAPRTAESSSHMSPRVIISVNEGAVLSPKARRPTTNVSTSGRLQSVGQRSAAVVKPSPRNSAFSRPSTTGNASSSTFMSPRSSRLNRLYSFARDSALFPDQASAASSSRKGQNRDDVARSGSRHSQSSDDLDTPESRPHRRHRRMINPFPGMDHREKVYTAPDPAPRIPPILPPLIVAPPASAPAGIPKQPVRLRSLQRKERPAGSGGSNSNRLRRKESSVSAVSSFSVYSYSQSLPDTAAAYSSSSLLDQNLLARPRFPPDELFPPADRPFSQGSPSPPQVWERPPTSPRPPIVVEHSLVHSPRPSPPASEPELEMNVRSSDNASGHVTVPKYSPPPMTQNVYHV